MWHRTDQHQKKGTFACVSKPRPRNSRNSETNSDSWLGSCAWSSGRPSRTTRSLAGLLSPQASYSPKCLEGECCELRHDGVLGSPLLGKTLIARSFSARFSHPKQRVGHTYR